MNSKILNSYFLVLFSFIPASIIIGPAISLANILLIDISFIFLIFYKKDFKFLSDKTVKIIILLCLYLIFNSFIAQDFSISANRNLGFIRFGILFLAFNYFLKDRGFLKNFFLVWMIIISIVILDIYFERVTGANVLGYGSEYINGIQQPNGNRVVSFFKDEPIVGGYIYGFYLIIIGYLFFFNERISNKYKYIIFIFSIFFLTAIILTGERSNSIKAILGFFLFYFLNDHFKFKEKILSVILLVLLFIFLLNTSNFLKLRYGGQFFKPIISIFQTNNEISIEREANKNLYIALYQSGFEVFKKYKIFGVGNKNYRLETCSNEKNPKYICSTHPHQLYFEFLAEHGIVGTLILIFILFSLILSKIKIILGSKNYLQLGCLIFLLTSFIPLLPSGAFFADYNLTIFWINLSIMYAVGNKTNVFRLN